MRGAMHGIIFTPNHREFDSIDGCCDVIPVPVGGNAEFKWDKPKTSKQLTMSAFMQPVAAVAAASSTAPPSLSLQPQAHARAERKRPAPLSDPSAAKRHRAAAIAHFKRSHSGGDGVPSEHGAWRPQV